MFYVKNNENDTVAEFTDKVDAEDFVGNHKAFALTIESDFDDNLEKLTEYLDNVGKWTEDYVFDNSDYADSYYCLVTEDSITWRDRIREWVSEEYPHLSEKFADSVWENCEGKWDSEAEAIRNEYDSYSGKGCCIGSFGIEEYEQQLDFSDQSICTELHESGELDDYLDEYNGDVYPCRAKHRVKNEDTGHYEYVGRELYNPHNHKNATLEVIVGVGGQVRFVIPEERMRELVVETILEVARE